MKHTHIWQFGNGLSQDFENTAYSVASKMNLDIDLQCLSSNCGLLWCECRYKVTVNGTREQYVAFHNKLNNTMSGYSI